MPANGGVLVVANVHRDFTSGGLRGRSDLATTAVAATRTLHDAASPASDDVCTEYLSATRALYNTGLAPGGWFVGGGLLPALGMIFGPGAAWWRNAAYLNVSCGQFPEGGTGLSKTGSCDPSVGA